MTTTQICIVSDRLVPNLIPALMLKPERLLLLSSPEMAEAGITARLEAMLVKQGFDVSVAGGLPSGGMTKIAAFACSVLERWRASHPTDSVILNISGGNKLMAIVLTQAIGTSVDGVIYTDTAHGVLETLAVPQGGDASPRPLESALDVALYLEAQGLHPRAALDESPDWEQAVRARRSLTKYLGKRARGLADFIGIVNSLASSAMDERGDALIRPLQQFKRTPRGLWAEAAREIDAAGLARWDGAKGLTFTDAEAARYLGGGWLEEYAWLVARELRPDDVRLGLEGDWEGTKRGRNELDVVIVHRNRLLLIECKTSRHGRDLQDDAALLYKLDSVGDDVRGLFGEVMLLSAREPSALINDRADHHQIQVMGPERLPTLQRDIRDWMDTGRLPAG